MINLNLPPIEARLQESPQGLKIFDRLRRKFVHLTPEEWVRQHFVDYLINQKGYQPGVMANEIGITLNGTRRRCDTVVFGHDGQPAVIVEYKAPSVALTQEVFNQIVRYNMVLRARYLMVSNGLTHYCCSIDYAANKVEFLPRIPSYGEIRL